MLTAQFWKDTLERVVATLATTLLALGGVDATGWLTADWKGIGLALLLVAGLTLTKCLAAAKIGDPDTAAMLPDETTVDPGAQDVADDLLATPYSAPLDETPAAIPERQLPYTPEGDF